MWYGLLPQYVEFTAKDVTKGAALAELAKRMGHSTGSGYGYR